MLITFLLVHPFTTKVVDEMFIETIEKHQSMWHIISDQDPLLLSQFWHE